MTKKKQHCLHHDPNKEATEFYILIYSFLYDYLSTLVKKMEGFSPKDLGSLLDRAFHRATIRKMKTSKGNLR